MDPKTAQLERLAAYAQGLGPDELSVLILTAEGLARGRGVYGEMVLTEDGRDWVAETLEEVRDGLVYVGAALVRLGGAK